MKSHTIAIAGFPGSGSTTTALLLSKELSLNYFNIGQVFKDISRGKIKEKFYYPMLKEFCDEKELIIPDFSSSNDLHGALDLWNTDFGKSKDFHSVLDSLQVNLANHGNIIIDGKLSLFMIPNADLKIWLKASLETRALRAANRDRVSLEEARRLVAEIQEKLRTEWEIIYGLDCMKQEEKANLVIDTTFLTPKQVVERIILYVNNKL